MSFEADIIEFGEAVSTERTPVASTFELPKVPEVLESVRVDKVLARLRDDVERADKVVASLHQSGARLYKYLNELSALSELSDIFQ